MRLTFGHTVRRVEDESDRAGSEHDGPQEYSMLLAIVRWASLLHFAEQSKNYTRENSFQKRTNKSGCTRNIPQPINVALIHVQISFRACQLHF